MKILVRALREAREWSQEDLASAAHVRTATISDVENGKNTYLSTLEKVAIALGVHVLDLFEDDRDDPETQSLIARVRQLGAEERKSLSILLPRKPE